MNEYPPEREPAGEHEPVRPEDPMTHAPSGEMDARRESSATGTRETARTALLSTDETHSYKARWSDIQAAFVDQPREAVSQADRLAGEVIDRLSAIFSDERRHLQNQWERSEEASTEDLRLALRRYRSLIDRLLSS